MTLYCLTTVDPKASRGLATWFFDSHAQFVAAKRLAELNNIFVSEQKEFISDANEFRDWLSERARETA